MTVFLPLLLFAQSADNPGADLQPATESAIVAAGKACVGVTVDPTGQDARVAGWPEATAAQRGTAQTDGRVLMRDNVRLIYKTGIDGGCVVFARSDAAFDATAFYADLGAAIGVPVVTDPKEPVTKLPNGEVLIAQVATDKDRPLVMIVVGNPNGKYAAQKGK